MLLIILNHILKVARSIPGVCHFAPQSHIYTASAEAASLWMLLSKLRAKFNHGTISVTSAEAALTANFYRHTAAPRQRSALRHTFCSDCGLISRDRGLKLKQF